MKIKKSNIEIVKGYLAGERPFVTVGYVPPPVQRKDGDEWVDTQGLKWVQRHGYKTRVNEQADMIREASQTKCACGQNIRYGNRLDEKFFIKTGKCFDCVVKEETELRILGVYPHYENYKMLSNYLGFLEDVKQKIEDSIKYFETESGTLEVLCNGEGFIEKFKGMDVEGLLETARKDLEEITSVIEKVTKDKEEAKKIYDDELKKARKSLPKKKKQK
jgi:hypothetical protein